VSHYDHIHSKSHLILKDFIGYYALDFDFSFFVGKTEIDVDNGKEQDIFEINEGLWKH